MRNLRMIQVGALVIASVIGLTGPSQSSAGASHTTVVSETPVNIATFDACTNENVFLSGTFRFVVGSTVDASGGLHQTQVAVWVGVVGTGQQSGDRYRFVAANPFILQLPSSGSAPFLTLTGVTMSLLLAKGSTDDLALHIVGHATVSPSGHVTDFSMETLECRG